MRSRSFAVLAAGAAFVFAMSLPAVSKHLSVLENAGLIAREREGRSKRCRVRAAPLRGAAEWIETYRRFWEDQFDALAAYLEEEGRRQMKGDDDDKSAGKGRRRR